MCPGIFVQGPETPLRAQRLAFRCPVARGRAARIDSTLRVMINHDIYYFSSRAARARFEADPLRYCRTLTDPITRGRFTPTPRSPWTVYDGRRYYFPSVTARAQFVAQPDSFAVRRGGG